MTLQLRIQTESCELTPRERKAIDDDLRNLLQVTEVFPVADLHMHVHLHPNKRDYHVTAHLHLPKRVLVKGGRGTVLQEVSEQCIRKLVAEVKTYKEKMSGISEGRRRAIEG